MSTQDERQSILERFSCAHVRLTRAASRDGSGTELFQWAPGCVHPKMHTVFNGELQFCDRCPCYTARAKAPR